MLYSKSEMLSGPELVVQYPNATEVFMLGDNRICTILPGSFNSMRTRRVVNVTPTNYGLQFEPPRIRDFGGSAGIIYCEHKLVETENGSLISDEPVSWSWQPFDREIQAAGFTAMGRLFSRSSGEIGDYAKNLREAAAFCVAASDRITEEYMTPVRKKMVGAWEVQSLGTYFNSFGSISLKTPAHFRLIPPPAHHFFKPIRVCATLYNQIGGGEQVDFQMIMRDQTRVAVKRVPLAVRKYIFTRLENYCRGQDAYHEFLAK